MEETVFIKCESPGWQVDEEESLTAEPNPLSLSDFMEEIKVEPVEIADEEEPSVIVKVKRENQEGDTVLLNDFLLMRDVKEEIQIEECSIREAPTNEVEHSKRSKRAAKHPYTEEGERCRCSICGRTFTHGRYLKTHLVVHTREKKTCLLCKREFLRQSTLARHMLLHFNVNRLVCSICGKKFTTCSNLKTHMFLHSLHQTSANWLETQDLL